MSDTLTKLLELIDSGYSGGEARLAEDLPMGERGDTLADFLAAEVRQCCEGAKDEDMEDIAVIAIDRAITQLQNAIAAVERA